MQILIICYVNALTRTIIRLYCFNCLAFTAVKGHSKLPVLIGSGVTIDNVREFVNADGLIVGSHFKNNGRWDGELDPKKVIAFMNKVKTLRRQPES